MSDTPTSDDLRAKVQEAGKYASGIMTDIDLLRWAADRITELEAKEMELQSATAAVIELVTENEQLREAVRVKSDRLDLSMLQVQEKQAHIKDLEAENARLRDTIERELTIGEDR